MLSAYLAIVEYPSSFLNGSSRGGLDRWLNMRYTRTGGVVVLKLVDLDTA